MPQQGKNPKNFKGEIFLENKQTRRKKKTCFTKIGKQYHTQYHVKSSHIVQVAEVSTIKYLTWCKLDFIYLNKKGKTSVDNIM